MFDRYIPCPLDDFHDIDLSDTPLPPPTGEDGKFLPDMGSIKSILSGFKLSDISSGDLLLLGLFVFLLNRKADEELLIAMGLLLIL